MLGNAIKQTSATTGTGNVALAAATGYPTFANVFAIGQPFSYTLLDANGLFIEAGIGYLADASTMVRARIAATFASGVYNNASPTAANLSGTTTVICTPHAAIVESMVPTVDPNAPVRMLSSPHRISTLGSITAVGNRLYYVPFLFRCAAAVNSLIVNVTTAVASSKTRGGIYSMTQNGVPGVLLATTTDIDASTTGLKIFTLAQPLSLPPGWYYMAFASSGSVGVTGYGTGPNNILGGMPLGYAGNMNEMEFRFDTLTANWTDLPEVANNPTTGMFATNNFGQPMTFPGVA